MSTAHGIDRRTFFKLVGGGIVVFVSTRPSALFAQQRHPKYPDDFNAYLRIGDDGRVTVFTGKIEMGQGAMTSQAQMVAEDLGVSLAAIDMVLGDTDRCPWDMGTFGSLTTRMFGPVLRAAAAEARAVLLRLAGARLGAAPEQLVVQDGVVSVVGEPARTVTYAELAQGKQIARTVGEKAVLRAASELTVMGRSPKRLDGPDKVTGAARYAGDIRLPGMLHARILRPPSHGATLAKLDASAAEKMAGISVVKQGNLIAVLHADPELAAAGRDGLKAEWRTEQARVDQDSIFDHLVKSAPKPQVKAQRGDPAAARANATRLFERTYRKGYVAHAPLEPHAAVAEFKDGKMTVWASTQTPFPMREQIAEALGLAVASVRVITPYVGGGFGGKGVGQQAIEAARLARITGQPVQVAWTRAEEFFFDTFDPAAVVTIVSAIDADGRISLWDYDVYAAGDRGTALFYDIPNASIRAHGGWMGGGAGSHPFGVGAWRAPGANMNVFAGESHIDVMAAAAGVDPVEFRLRNTTDPRMRRVLTAAAEAFGWTPATAPSGKGRGVACGIDAGTYVALMAQVRVDAAQGAVQVERVVCAQDMGLVVNPEGATMQIEGCVTMGLGYTFAEEIRFRGGEIADRNFGTYGLPRFSWLPRIETVLVSNDALAPQGGGEPAIVPVGAVMANAVFDATGARLLRLPMTPERVRDALRPAREKEQPASAAPRG